MQTRSVTSDDLLVISANEDAAGEPGDLIFKTSGVERGRIKSDGSTSGVIGAGGAVASVFGRAGAVAAGDGDYFGVVAAAKTGATAAGRFVGATVQGPPSSGTFAVGDEIIDQSGRSWVCYVAGTPGTWSPLNQAILHAEAYGFTANGNAINVDSAWTALKVAINAATPFAPYVSFPCGLYSTTAAVTLPTIPGMRLVGQSGQPSQTSGAPNRFQETTFQWDGAGSTTMFTQDGGSGGVMKGGVRFVDIHGYNNKAGPDYTVNFLKLANVNDWAIVNPGFKFFGRNVWVTAVGGGGMDNAHGTIVNPFSYSSDNHLYVDVCFSLTMFGGGEVIGDGNRIQYFAFLNVGAGEVTMRDVKGVGCTGGIVCNGGYGLFDGIRQERCGDSSHPVMDVPSTGSGTIGAWNRIIGCTFTGGGSVTSGTVSGVNALNSASIAVTSTAGYATSGAVVINNATLVTYTSIDGTHFLGCSAHPAYAGGESLAQGILPTRFAALGSNNVALYNVHDNMGNYPGLHGGEVQDNNTAGSNSIFDAYSARHGINGWHRWQLNNGSGGYVTRAAGAAVTP